MLDNHLKDGEWDKASEDIKHQTMSVRPTNTIHEWNFAPNVSLLVLETDFVNNKTIDWLYNNLSQKGKSYLTLYVEQSKLIKREAE